jgi:hypothetical protein
MKPTKSILMGALAALSIASASAETVYITGSTAFRSAANSALYNLYGANLLATDQATTNSTSAGNLIFTNCSVGGTTVDIVVAWGGSEAGIQSVACGTNNKTLPFYDRTKIDALGGSYPKLSLPGGSMSTLATNANTSLAKGNIAFSDTYQGASVFTGTAPDGATYNALSDAIIGVVPFTFVASKNFPYSDITTTQFGDLGANGFTTGNNFSGSSADTNVKIWLMGRNPDSGTRVTTLADTKYGVSTPVLQFSATAGSGTVTALAKSAAATINGISIAAGNNGESSGGTLCGYMTNVLATNVTVPIGFSRGAGGNYLVAYAGVSDAAGKYASGLKYLTFNGIQGRAHNSATVTNADAGYTNIITGKYPFWGYEHVMYDAAYASAGVSNVVSALTNYITPLASTSSTLAPNISLSDMLVKRTKDGGPIVLK